MSEATIVAAVVAVMAAIPPTIAALAAYWQSRAALLSANRAALASDQLNAKTDGLVGQVKEVHTITNSNLSAVKAELAMANQRITSLVEMVSDLKSERQKSEVAVALAMPAPEAASTLKQIETNTGATVDALTNK